MFNGCNKKEWRHLTRRNEEMRWYVFGLHIKLFVKGLHTLEIPYRAHCQLRV